MDPTPTPPVDESAGPGVVQTDDVLGRDVPCIDPNDGSPTDCDSRTAALLLDSESCDPAVFLARRGLEPGLEALSLRFDVVGDSCQVTPGEQARAAGARASDILDIERGVVSPALRECTRSVDGPSISCADPHEIEWVGGWRYAGSTPHLDVCLDAARQYTGRRLAGADPLTVEVVTTEDEDGVRAYRCALRAPGYLLAGSVRGLGERPLPTAS